MGFTWNQFQFVLSLEKVLFYFFYIKRSSKCTTFISSHFSGPAVLMASSSISSSANNTCSSKNNSDLEKKFTHGKKIQEFFCYSKFYVKSKLTPSEPFRLDPIWNLISRNFSKAESKFLLFPQNGNLMTFL